jgi:hypothetical protein
LRGGNANPAARLVFRFRLDPALRAGVAWRPGSTSRERMKTVQILIAAGLAVCQLSAAQAAPARHHAKARAPSAPAAPQSSEARYHACLFEAFRRFGWHYGERVVLYSDFAVTQADFCMRNGGHY